MIMKKLHHPKTIRRWILTKLYERYLENPTEMLGPEDFLESGLIDKKQLAVNIHYLYDMQLVELITGYNPPMFVAARITPKGIDLIENPREFDLLFPEYPVDLEGKTSEILETIENLVFEADLLPLDGPTRKCLQRDIQYLRAEFAQPAKSWRKEVIKSVLRWIESAVSEIDKEEFFPSLLILNKQISELFSEDEKEL